MLELLIAAVATAPAVALADEGDVSLTGSDGADTTVFKGRVDGIHDRAAGVRLVTATNGSRELAQARLNRSFEQQDAGQIIQALASELGLSTELPGERTDAAAFRRRRSRQHVRAHRATGGLERIPGLHRQRRHA